MNILAVDPGLAHLGWAALYDGAYTCGTTNTEAKESLHDRLDALVTSVPFRPYNYLVMENCFGPAKTKLDYVIGSLIAALDHKFYVLVSPAKWKKAVCPKGTKETYGKQMFKLVKKTYNIVPDSQHAADALGLLAWFQRFGLKELTK
jgi:Holliday junction resolvasome RuvABC endonuclease subunit